MARQTQIGIEEIQRAKQLRDQATTIAEYRKALSVILAAELALMPTGLRSYSVRVAGLFFVTVAVFAIKTTLQKTYGVAAGIVL